MHRFQAAFGRRLGSVGKWSANHPWTTLGLCALTTLLCTPGFLRFSTETLNEKLWTEQDSAVFDRKRYIDADWGPDPSPFRFLIQAKNAGQNALTMAAFRNAFDVVDEVLAVEANGKTYADLCVRSSTGECVSLGPLRFFSWNRTMFEAEVSSDNDLRAILSAEEYPDNGRVIRDEVFGGLETSGSQILGAAVWRVDFLLDPIKEDVAVWQAAVLDHFVSSDFAGAQQRWPDIHLEVWSFGRSVEDELARSVSGDISFFIWAYLFLIVGCSVMLGPPLKCVEGRRVLGVCEFFLVVAASVCGYGVGSALGVPFVSIHQILPFILVGIGVDNAYVLAGAFDATDPTQPIPERVQATVEEAGVSITLTSATSIAGFLIGTSAAFPAVSHFCVYGGLSLVFIYAFHITGFCAMLSLDQQRQAAGRLDCLCCLKRRARTLDSNKDDSEEREYLSTRVMEKFARAITSHIVVKLAIIGAFLGLAGICLWQGVANTDTNFAIVDLAPDVSYMRRFFETETEYWGGDSTNLDSRVNLFFRGVDPSRADVQAQLASAESALLGVSCINSERGIASWHRAFSSWARANKDTPPRGLWTSADFQLVDGQEFLTGPQFNAAVQYWLSNCSLGCFFQRDVMWQDGVISASRATVVQLNLPTADVQVDCLEEVEDFIEKSDERLPGTFAFQYLHLFYHAYGIIRQELLVTIGLCFVCVLVVASFLITHPAAVLIIFGVIFLVFVDLLGAVPIVGVSLNSISFVNLVMAIGLVVDYSMHIAHCFMSQDAGLSRDQRVVIAMKTMGVSVSLGIVSTFLAVVPLAFATSEVFRVFFKLLVCILVLGGSHGLILMPVVLSLVGPAGKHTPPATGPPAVQDSEPSPARKQSPEDSAAEGCDPRAP